MTLGKRWGEEIDPKALARLSQHLFMHPGQLGLLFSLAYQHNRHEHTITSRISELDTIVMKMDILL
jgi:hypothetical protein